MSKNDFFDSSDMSSKVKEWASGVIKDIKSAFGINSPSTIMRDEVGKYLSLGVAKGLTENNKYVVEAFEGMLEKLKYQRELDVINDEEYYAGLEKLRDKYFSKGTENWVKYTAEIYKYQKKVLEEEKKVLEEQQKALEKEKKSIDSLYDDITGYAEKRLDSVIKKQQQMADGLMGQSRFYTQNRAIMYDATYSYYSLNNLDSDIKLVERYADCLTKINEKFDKNGFDRSMTATLMKRFDSMGLEEAVGVASAVAALSDDRFTEYFSNWEKLKNISEGAAATRYKNEFEASCDDAADYMKDALQKAGYDIPEGFYTSGSISAEKFGEGFVDGISAQMEMIRAKINEFNADITVGAQGVGNTYNTTNTSYNIQASSGADTVEQIRRYDTIKRLSGA